jgi:hypothetical protein
MKVAVCLHPAFDLQADHQLYTRMSWRACEGRCVGDPYVRDDDDNVVDFDDEDSRMCPHCSLTCWCDQREWAETDLHVSDEGDEQVVDSEDEKRTG